MVQDATYIFIIIHVLLSYSCSYYFLLHLCGLLHKVQPRPAVFSSYKDPLQVLFDTSSSSMYDQQSGSKDAIIVLPL